MNNNQDLYLCLKCFKKIMKPTKQELKHAVLTEYEDNCEQCGKYCQLVDHIEDKEYGKD